LEAAAIPRVGNGLDSAGWPSPPPAASVLAEMAKTINSAESALLNVETKVHSARENVAKVAAVACRLRNQLLGRPTSDNDATVTTSQRRAALRDWSARAKKLLQALVFASALLIDVPEAASLVTEAGRAAVETVVTDEVVSRARSLRSYSVDDLLTE
jgi:hypothetical protein